MGPMLVARGGCGQGINRVREGFMGGVVVAGSSSAGASSRARLAGDAGVEIPGPLGSIDRMSSAFPSSLHGAVVAWVLACAASHGAGLEWPEWRGPGADGHAGKDARGLPLTWGEGTNVAWRCDLPGRGWSSPVIDGNQVWLTTAVETEARPEDVQRRLKSNTGDQPLTLLDKVELVALCVDRRSGRLVRTVSLASEKDPQWVHTLNSYASPTPVLEKDRAYLHFGTFGTYCVDTSDGRVVWRNMDLRIMHENGPGSSPVLAGDLLVFHLDGSDTQSVVALEKKTGKVAWRTARSGEMNANPQLKKSYATPALLRLGGKDVLLSQGADWLYAYDPRTGAEQWKVKYGQLGFSLSSRAVFGQGNMYLCTGYARSEAQAIRIEGGEPTQVWRYAKGAPTMSSPLLVGGELYFVSDTGGMFTCLDARTGAEVYRERLGGNHCSSPLLAEGRIYLGDRDGVTSVIEPGRRFRVLARNTLDGKIMASPAAVGDSLYLRTDKALYRLRQGGQR